jgi:AcrR family transcriptional regulator
MTLTRSKSTEKAQSGLSEPLQQRSRESLDRMLTALEALLSERGFDKITIADIAMRAEVSTGSVYGRFADKSALLIGLHRRVHERSEPCRRRLANPQTWKGHGVDDLVRGVIRAAVRYFRANGDVFRAVAYWAPPEVFVIVAEEIKDFTTAMIDLVLIMAPGADRASVARAVGSANEIVTATLNFRFAYSKVAKLPQMSTQRLTDDLVALTLAFLRPAIGR